MSKQMSKDDPDQHLDAVLRASGSALKHYTMDSTKNQMRASMRDFERAIRATTEGESDALREALTEVLAILPVCPQNTGIAGIEARYNFAVVGARAALARAGAQP